MNGENYKEYKHEVKGVNFEWRINEKPEEFFE
jgi:hypothetical protein